MQKQVLQGKQDQRQVATQQTIRLMQLVELPYTSLEQEILKTVDENPALEVISDDTPEDAVMQEDVPQTEYDENGDPWELSDTPISDDNIFQEDFYRDDDIEDYPSEQEIENRIQKINAPDDQDKSDRSGVFYSSVQEQWQLQLGEMNMTDRQSQIAQYLVGCLDENGYFAADIQSVANEFLYMFNLYTDADEVEYVLTRFVQELDPAGTGARNLQECLLLQLKRAPQENETMRHAIRILDQCFEPFTKKHYNAISKTLNITDEQLKDALMIIKKLDPRPAANMTPIEKNADLITPDFTITSNDGKLNLSLNNQYVPKIRINKEFSNEYRFLTKEVADKKRAQAEKFIRDYVTNGEQFIGMLSTREMILYNTMYAIMKHQEEYFLTGDDANLKPMILKTIAQEVNMDVSTISRVSNSKYVQTDFGIIPLKHLFSESVNDEDVSSKEIKRILTDVINAENKKKPYSDDKLEALLKQKGYNIARRTIAKYREQLGIPVARLRKEI